MAGLALFMLGMTHLEDALKRLAGRRFKLFLQRQSTSKLRSIASAALITGILQSSSVVNVMILVFVGAGITKMQHALALMLGTNLGTTLGTWFVATVGFKFDVKIYALPIIAISAFWRLIASRESLQHTWSGFLLGFGFLFLGLDYMNAGLATLVGQMDLNPVSQYPAILFLIGGIFITAIIQSSSATVAVTLSALYAHALSFYTATAIVLGAELGTTMKLFIIAANGSVVKKRVALGNFLYNATIVLFVFFLLKPIDYLITDIISVKDPLIALPFFQTFINTMGIIMFLPLLHQFGQLLERAYKREKKGLHFIADIPGAEVDIALEALKKEIHLFINYTVYFAESSLGTDHAANILPTNSDDFKKMPVLGQYEYLKQYHGDIFNYCIKMQKEPVALTNARTWSRLTNSLRNAMYAAKSIKDALPDITQLENSGNDIKYHFLLQCQQNAKLLFSLLAQLLSENRSSSIEEITRIYKVTEGNYEQNVRELSKPHSNVNLSEVEISTLLNFNRELYTAYKALIFAVKDNLLATDDNAYFDTLPGFIA